VGIYERIICFEKEENITFQGMLDRENKVLRKIQEELGI